MSDLQGKIPFDQDIPAMLFAIGQSLEEHTIILQRLYDTLHMIASNTGNTTDAELLLSLHQQGKTLAPPATIFIDENDLNRMSVDTDDILTEGFSHDSNA